ncbi:hypothetical protein C0J52_10907 [Blattella germanica]|nr:hypothetical protein C0J52_10907 [Blattella germanica]
MESGYAGSTSSLTSTTPISRPGLRTRSRCCPSIFGHHMISVEPVIFLLVMTQSIAGPVITQFLLVRTCTSNFNYNSTTCSELDNPKNETKVLETEVQPIATEILMTKRVLESVIPAVIALFLGPWSDKYGRKTPVIWALLGYFLIASVPFILSGGYMTITACTITLLADITAVHSRSLRMGIYEGVLYLGYVMGMFLTPPIFRTFGKDSYVVVFGFNAVTCFLNAIYVYIFIPESIEIKENADAPYKNLTKLFDWQFLKKTLKVCFTKRDDCRRDIILYMAIVMAANLFVFDGESVVSYLFTRLKFSWEIEHFTVFNGLVVLLMACGVVFALILAVEGLMPLVAAPVYASVYKSTLTTWPGTVYYVTTVVYITCIFLNSYVMYDQNRSSVLDQLNRPTD